jgi:hypothetical protein
MPIVPMNVVRVPMSKVLDDEFGTNHRETKIADGVLAVFSDSHRY